VRVERDLEGLKLSDLSDREFLLVIRDAGAMPGVFVSAQDIADHLRLTGEHPLRSVSSRMSWMRRLGVVERDPDSKGWCLSELGLQMAVGKLKKAQEEALERLQDGQMLVTVHWMTRRVQNDPTVGRMMDRAYRSGLGKR
jgi:hypothetical protein